MARRTDADLHAQLAEAQRRGDHATAAEARRDLEDASGESYREHYNRRFREMLAIPADELI